MDLRLEKQEKIIDLLVIEELHSNHAKKWYLKIIFNTGSSR